MNLDILCAFALLNTDTVFIYVNQVLGCRIKLHMHMLVLVCCIVIEERWLLTIRRLSMMYDFVAVENYYALDVPHLSYVSLLLL